MQIKHVEELVGITRKNIRFYEDQGLLSPRRADNGYREYHEEEIKRLKQIKILRKLSIPIEEIKRVFDGECSLDMCLDRHLEELERQKKSLEQMQELSRRLIDRHTTLNMLEADECLEELERLEKEGVRFMDVNNMDTHRRKTAGALIGAASMTVIMAVIIGFILWAHLQEPLPIGLLLVIIAAPAAIIIGTLAALIGRIKEIKGGEEDEASKY
jgi:DNA-binding transcriptional MerR regulator